MSLLELHRTFLAATVDRLAADERVAAVVLTGSGGRGEADEWSDLDITVIADDDESETMLSSAASAEHYGDLAVWVDCSFKRPAEGSDDLRPLSRRRRPGAHRLARLALGVGSADLGLVSPVGAGRPGADAVVSGLLSLWGLGFPRGPDRWFAGVLAPRTRFLTRPIVN